MTDPADDLFAVLESQIGPPRCQCSKDNHPHPLNACTNPAVVAIRLHMVGHCIEAHAKRPDLVDANGDGSQILCNVCWIGVQTFLRGAMMATMARIKAIALATGEPSRRPVCECGKDLMEFTNLVRVVDRFDQ